MKGRIGVSRRPDSPMPLSTLRLFALAAASVALSLLASPALAAPAPAPPLTQDVNGDGVADLVYSGRVGSSAIDSQAVLVLGSRDRSAPTGAAGRVFRFPHGSISGASIVGDVNGDGLADILVTTDDPGARIAWVIYGSAQPRGFTLPD